MLTSRSHLALFAVLFLFCLSQTLVDAQTSAYAMWFQPGVQITKVSSSKYAVEFQLKIIDYKYNDRT